MWNYDRNFILILWYTIFLTPNLEKMFLFFLLRIFICIWKITCMDIMPWICYTINMMPILIIFIILIVLSNDSFPSPFYHLPLWNMHMHVHIQMYFICWIYMHNSMLFWNVCCKRLTLVLLSNHWEYVVVLWLKCH